MACTTHRRPRRTMCWLLLLLLMLLLPCARAQHKNAIEAFKARQAAAGAPAATEAAKQPKVPNKWHQQAKGYDKALEVQQETGADIFVFFWSDRSKSEKGLSRWFETKALNTPKLRRYLRDYIKVKVKLPGNPASQAMAEEFRVRKCPAVFIVQTNGWSQYCKLFEKVDDRLRLKETEDLIEVFRNRSGLRYYDPDKE